MTSAVVYTHPVKTHTHSAD